MNRPGWEADFDYPVRKDCDVLFVSLNRTERADRDGVVYGHNLAFWNKLWLGGLLHRRVSHEQTGMMEVFGSKTEKGMLAKGNLCFVDLLDRLDKSSTSISVTNMDINALKYFIKDMGPKGICIMHSKPWNIIQYQITGNLRTEGFGRFGNFCGRPFFRVPAPEGSNKSNEVHKEAYGEIQQFIDSLGDA